MLLAEFTIDWSNGLVIAAVAYLAVREGLSALKDRGIDLRKQQEDLETVVRHIGPTHGDLRGTNERVRRLSRIFDELEPFEMKKKINETHECHLGINAVDANNKPKWWNDRDHEAAILETMTKLLHATETSIAVQKTQNELLSKVIQKD